MDALGPGADLVVVDNGGGDWLAPIISSIPAGRMVSEPRQGLSHARNRALAEATGDVVVFVDDDVSVSPAWLAAHLAAHRRRDTVCVGGPVTLRWPTSGPPRWYTPRFAGFFSGLDHGGPARVVGRSELPIGANLSVHRDAALAVGGFNPSLGRDGRSLRSGEDIDFSRRLLAWEPTGIWWEPAAAVTHHVRPERRQASWLLRRALAAGATEALHHRQAGRPAIPLRRLLTAQSAAPNEPLLVRCVGFGLRAAIATGYWKAQRR